MITYEDLQKANEITSSVRVKEKDYIEVNQRIKAFRFLFPEGYIKTEIVSLENGVCVMRAECGTDEGKVLGVGTAYEKEGSTFINKTSYIENCETSAVGRALGMAGIGIDVSVASAEEVQNAIINQKQDEKLDKVHVKSIRTTIENANGKFTEEGVCNYFKIKKIEDMTYKMQSEFLRLLNDASKKTKGE